MREGSSRNSTSRNNILRTAVVMAALAGGIGLAAAQAPASPKDKGEADQQSQAEKAMRSPSGKAGKEEPGSHVPTSRPQEVPVLVNGVLTAPGAAADGDTAPAKFSAKNAADDKLITVAYTFKALTDEQRNAIFGALKNQPARTPIEADVGTELPLATTLNAVPDDLAAKIPQTGAYQYAVSGNRVLLVEPFNRVVVAVISEVQDRTTGAGGREPSRQ